MNRIKSNSLLLLITLILAILQALYMATIAQSNGTTQLEILSIALLGTHGITTTTNATRKDEQLTKRESHFIKGTAIYASKISTDEANRLAQDGILISTDSKNNYIDLADGNILLNTAKDMIVGTSAGEIYIGAQAIVFIMKSDNATVLYDLCQTKPKQVSVRYGNHKLPMQPGQMFVLTGQNTNDFEKLELNCHSIAYCNPQSLGNWYSQQRSVNVFIADFSIASALVIIQPLRQLTVSNNSRDKITLANLMKGAGILGDLIKITQ